MNSSFKKIILCADDFGLNEEISQGILKLVRLKRLSAVSCMVNRSDFANHARDLLPLKHQVQTGLHFTLTEGPFLSIPGRAAFTLNELLIKTHLRFINPELIAKEFNAQLDRYIQVMNSAPDFIDGHQHVHQFPMVRDLILNIYQHRFPEKKICIRATSPATTCSSYRFKTTILAFTGGYSLSGQLKKHAIPHNSFFSGVYDFNPDVDYRALFRQWLSLSPSNTLIMCHPGEQGNTPDVIAAARAQELDYFLSDAFLSDCNEFSVALTE